VIPISPFNPEIDAIWQAVSATGARSIAVVSAQPDEGASQIATALARRAGQFAAADAAKLPRRPMATNARALLVDLDLVCPSQAIALGLTARDDEIIRLDDMNLAVLGRIGPAFLEAWRERPVLAEQLMTWRSDWSFVVLDTEPLLKFERRRGARSTEADRRANPESNVIAGLAAAAAADACVLVTLAGRTSGSRIRAAREKLTAAGANLIGSILNDRDNPSLLAELDRQTYRFAKYFPNWMAGLRARMHRSPILTVRI